MGDSCEQIVVPANAQLTGKNSAVDQGWECLPGYQQDGGRCAAINIPENAEAIRLFAAVVWECKRGYRQVRDRCEAVVVPENGYLRQSGSDWACMKPFRQRGNQCVARKN